MSDGGSQLSRRERQIMDVLFARGEASVNEIQAAIPDAPTTTAVRTMLHILEDKGVVKRRKEGRGYVYMPRQPRKRAGVKALEHVLRTFFEGSLEHAVAAHLANSSELSEAELERLQGLIEAARRQEEK